MSYNFRVQWHGTVIGEIHQAMPDMWYLEGQWVSSGTPDAQRFEELVSGFDLKEVYKDHTKGTRVLLLEDTASDNGTHAVVISLRNGSLFVRRYFEKEAITWLIDNIP